MQKFKKRILRFGTWNYGGSMLKITKDFADKLIENFKHSPFVPVLRGHNQKEAEMNPELIVSKNIDKLYYDDTGIYADFTMDTKEAEKYNDVSVGLHNNYENHETGKNIGPLLEHVALVTNPYIKGLGSFVQAGDNKLFNILLSDIMADKKVNLEEVEEKIEESTKTETDKTKEVEEVATEEDKEAEATTGESTEETTEEVEETEVKEVKEVKEVEEVEEVEEDKEEETKVETSEDLLNKIAKLEEDLQKSNAVIFQDRVDSKFQGLLSKGKVIPAQKNSFVSLFGEGSTIELSDRQSTLDNFVSFLNLGKNKIEFKEQGVNLETGDASFQKIGETEITMSDSQVEEIREIKKFQTKEETLEYIAKNKETFSKYFN